MFGFTSCGTLFFTQQKKKSLLQADQNSDQQWKDKKNKNNYKLY